MEENNGPVLYINRENIPKDMLTQQTLAATLGSDWSPSTRACNSGFKYCSFITASEIISQTRPTVHAEKEKISISYRSERQK